MTKKAIIFILLVFRSATSLCQTDSLTKTEPGRLGFGTELGPCTGMFFLSGDADKNLNSGWCYANVGLIISYKKFQFAPQLTGMSSTLKEDIQFSPDWKKNNDFSSTNFQLFSGYYLLNKKHHNIIPFATIGATGFNSRPITKGSSWVSTIYIPSYSFGIAYDFKMNLPVYKRNQFPGYENIVQYMYIRLITGVYPSYFQTPLKMNGSMYFANLSLGIYYKGLRIQKNKRT